MKKLIFGFSALLVLCTAFYSCTKTKNSSGGSGSAYTPLVPETTGWHKVGVVKFTYQNYGFAGQDDMRPEDIQKVGDEMYILYSEDFKLSGTNGRVFYKARFTPGSADTAVTTKLNLGYGTDRASYGGLRKQRFIPGAYTAMVLRFYANPSPNDYLAIMDEQNNEVSSHFVGHPSTEATIYSNGDVMSGAIDYSANAEMDFYKKATNTWTYVKGTSQDTTRLVSYTPFRLPDGTLCAFNVTRKRGKVYLAIANPTPGASYPTPLYHSLFLQDMPELAFDTTMDYGPTILGSIVDGNTFTVVLGSFAPGSDKIGKLHAYKWTQGDVAFTTIYNVDGISSADGVELKTNMKCRPDGVLYKWLVNSAGLGGDIYSTDGSGVHRTGTFTYPFNIFVGAITYIDGTYYMAAYYYSDQYDTDHKMRMDIIKYAP